MRRSPDHLVSTSSLSSVLNCEQIINNVTVCVFMAHTPEELQIILDAAVKTYSRMGMSVEVICQWRISPPPTMPVFGIEQQPLSIVPSFKYLGSIVSEDCYLDCEIKNRIRQASAAFGKLQRKVFQNKHLQLGTEVTIYKALCISTLLYSCEAWVVYSHHLRLLERFHIRCLHRILGITCYDYV